MPAASGTEAAPITFRSVAGATVIIDAEGRVPAWNWDGVIDLHDREWIVLNGLQIINSNWFGIGIKGGGHHRIINSRTYQTRASGVYATQAVDIKVLDSEIRRACQSTDLTAGSQECITMDSVDGFEIARNQVWDRPEDISWGGEGIDVKGNSRHGSIHHNEVHDNARLGIYVDAYGGELHTISVYANRVRNCRSGIVIANEVDAGYTRNVTVHDNVVWDCPAVGIRIAGYEGNGTIQQIAIYNNTVVDCGLIDQKWESGGLLVEADHPANAGLVVNNNLFIDNFTQIRTLEQSSLTLDRNLIRGDTESRGSRALDGDPLFVDAAADDFRLRSGSPAIDAAMGTPLSARDADDQARPLDGNGDGVAEVDLGAYEFRPAPPQKNE